VLTRRSCYDCAVSTETIAGLLAARAHDDAVGLRFEDTSWTWSAVVRESSARGAFLQTQAGGGPFHVGVLLDNVPEYVFLLGGAALVGAAVVGINPTRRGAELAHDIRHTDCRCIVTESRHAPLLAGLDVGLPPDRIHVVDESAWDAALSPYADAPLPPEPAADTLFVLIFTSGSTGAPKAVRGTQGRYARLGTRMPFAPDDVLYCSMPLFHGNALASNYVPALASGATIALRRKFSASEFFTDIRRFGASYFNTVGRALSYVLATPPSPDDREHRVKFALAPESSPADAAAFTERFGIPVFGGYGSSEGAIIIRPIADAPPGALGRPEAGTDVAVVDADGNECAVAELDDSGRLLNADVAIGEIVRRDPAVVFEGYYNNDEATRARSRNGWYWSGDLGYRDANGVFFFAGRTDDWLRVDGENFAAAPVERIIARHPAVAAVAVYAVPDAVTGDQVMAALELRPGAEFDPQQFATFLGEQHDLGTKWAPRFVRIVDALPVTGADKIAKLPLRRTGWNTIDPVWWRADQRDSEYTRFDASAANALRARFAEHGRDALL
jgi:fatty-acyl-CoA synthase